MKYFLVLTLSAVAFLSGCGSATPNNAVVVNTNPTVNTNTEPSGSAVEGGGQSQSAAAEALVADLYKQHDAKKSPFFQTKNRGLVDKYFTKPLADLIWKDANNSSGEVGAIDGDPLYNAQDMEIKNFAIGKAETKGDTGTVPVTFTNFGKKVTIIFSVKQVSGAWKIDNINYGADSGNLMQWLRETYSGTPDKAVSGEFEGKYQVGDTTCTVKAVKMAFEVRWAKGSGVEMFFAEGDNTFTSDPDKGEPNDFVFDDANYNTGKFLRGDGKTFVVKRIS
ncbi:MAG: DUF3828 domain-containing protein [Pyrinomonadaceae bacterium]|nr:DUF3828 domain-containing protein [Pyrinomonadaceae bacterium]